MINYLINLEIPNNQALLPIFITGFSCFLIMVDSEKAGLAAFISLRKPIFE